MESLGRHLCAQRSLVSPLRSASILLRVYARTRVNYLMRQNPCASIPSATLNFERLSEACDLPHICGARPCRMRQIAAARAPSVHPIYTASALVF